MNTHQSKIQIATLVYTLAIFSVVITILSGYLGYKYVIHTNAITALETERSNLILEITDTTRELTDASTTIRTLSATLSNTENKLDATTDTLRDEKNKNDNFEDQIKDIAGTVGVLDKLSKTDEELLQKYSKVYFLNENYIPSKLRQINKKYVLEGRDNQFFHGDALIFLKKIINDADDDGITLKVVSAFRSFDTQADLKGQYTSTFGSGANTFSADQGYSEHQLGTTVDFTDPDTNGTYLTFKETDTYAWLLKNAYKYGFILSYPEDNSFYTFEPWHWRFVGTRLAKDLHRDDAHFYDLDQREIDTYLINIFD